MAKIAHNENKAGNIRLNIPTFKIKKSI